MRIQLVSDLHFEIERLSQREALPGSLQYLPDVACDVVVLAGDVDTGLTGVRWAVRESRRLGKTFLYVFGNHEYYGHVLPGLLREARRITAGTSVHLLEQDECVLDGVRFLGCTLWTDFELHGDGEAVAGEVLALVADYRHIRVEPDRRRLTPSGTVARHRASRRWLQAALQSAFDGPTVVITHHAPSARSLSGEGRENALEAAYATDLESLMGAHVPLWLHGHVHRRADYGVDGTRVVCNPRGYFPSGLACGFSPEFVVALAT